MKNLLKIARENGFSSVESMDFYHEPIIKLVSSVMSCTSGNILDLGCGNGFLLKKIKENNLKIIPYGIDYNEEAINNAKLLQPEFSCNFFNGDVFDTPSILPDSLKFELVIITPGRFLEKIDQKKKTKLLDWLNKSSNKILAYAYGDWIEKYGNFRNILEMAGFEVIEDDIKNNIAIVRVKY